MRIGVAFLGAALMAGSGIAHAELPAGFTVTIENAGVKNASGAYFGGDINNYGVETFDSLSTGIHSTYVSDFGSSPITGTYTNLNVHTPDQYGGAGGDNNYAVAGISQTGSYAIDFSTENGESLTYFGYWLSALDGGNILEFYKSDGAGGYNLLGTFSPTDVIAKVGNNAGGTNPYYGNPDGAFEGQNKAEPYAFVNFFNESTGFDRIVFKQTTTAGYESDNHTVGWWKSQGGTPVGVPEPATWAMLIAGFGMIGGAMRSRNRIRVSLA
ncbi:PEPxxWA-CTERM sorting domain-containing protein [Sphingomonas flavalba]|uniref:Npun_F0296 family exosortase-dependent surface protein n=1 Tax=Sphingomonas flavalba TaxID=2559804 RepID=UPI001EF0B6F7|nr:PEPxxWA-CTERM sorting domain-containing protein [Sphingomonas flavalba]